MTEEEWMKRGHFSPMLTFLEGRASDRKLRFFGVACCSYVADLTRGLNLEELLSSVEQYADGLIPAQQLQQKRETFSGITRFHSYPTSDELGQARGDAKQAPDRVAASDPFWAARFTAYAVESATCWCAVRGMTYAERCASDIEDVARADIATKLSNLLRDIFGNPFRPVTLDPKCLLPNVQSLAQAIYNDRNFAQLPILADALEEVGSSQEDVLKHLRSGGEHVRGCFALDLVLGKS